MNASTCQQNLTGTLISLIQAAKEDPQRYLRGEALQEPHKILSRPETPDQREARILLAELTDYLGAKLHSNAS